jgi:hypothetical protein
MAAPDQRGTYWFRSAAAADAARVAELVDAAYGHYVERIGMLPGPMTDDYAEVIGNRQVTVAERHGAIVGIVVLSVTDEGFLVDKRRGASLASRGRAWTGPPRVRRSRGAACRVRLPLSLHPRADDGEPGVLRKDRIRRVRPALPRGVLACLPAQAPWMSLPIGPLGPPRGAGPWAATARPAAGDDL